MRGGTPRNRTETVDEDVSVHLDTVRHRRLFIQMRIVHPLLRRARYEVTVWRVMTLSTRADVRLHDHRLALVSGQRLGALIDHDALRRTFNLNRGRPEMQRRGLGRIVPIEGRAQVLQIGHLD